MEAIILAGGFGTRLKATVPEVPKPMAPIHGYPFLAYEMSYWVTQGIRRFIISVGYKADQIKSYFGERFADAEITYSEEKTPLGTGGGTRLALSLRSDPGPFLLLNGDTYFTVDLNALRGFHKVKKSELTMAVLRVVDPTRYDGVDVDAEGRVQRFDHEHTAGKHKYVNGGVYLIEPRLFVEKVPFETKLSLEIDLLPDFVAKKKKVFAFPSGAPFVDIGIPTDYDKAARMLDSTLLNSARRLRDAS